MEAKFGPIEKGIKRLTSIEIEFFRTAVCISFGHKRKEEVLKGLKVKLVDQKLRRYKSNWLRHGTRMDSSSMSKLMLNCRPNGRRRLERALKGQLDEVGTGQSRSDR
jgi:hypothetical protein